MAAVDLENETAAKNPINYMSFCAKTLVSKCHFVQSAPMMQQAKESRTKLQADKIK